MAERCSSSGSYITPIAEFNETGDGQVCSPSLRGLTSRSLNPVISDSFSLMTTYAVGTYSSRLTSDESYGRCGGLPAGEKNRTSINVQYVFVYFIINPRMRPKSRLLGLETYPRSRLE